MSAITGCVVVGGGTGFIGSYLCKKLRNVGYQVIIISRRPGPQCITWSDVQVSGLPKETTAVVNVSGQNVLDVKQRWTPQFKQEVYISRVHTSKILNQAITKNVRSFVSVTGVGIYNPDSNVTYDEDTDPGPCSDFFSKLCMEWERASETHETRSTIIRTGVVLGRHGGMIKQLYLPFMMGLGGPIGDGCQYLPWIHIEDLTNLIIFAIHDERGTGVINGVAPDIITSKQFAKTFAKCLSRPAFIRVPKVALDLLLSEERANLLTKGQKVYSKKTKEWNFPFQYPDIMTACRNLTDT